MFEVKPPEELSKTPLDRVISYLSPAWGRARQQEKAVALIERRQIAELSRSYRKGTVVSRVSTTRHIPSGSADYHTESLYEREDAYLHARDLERNNPVANALLERDVDNVVGTGHTPNALTSSKAWNQKAEELFRDWSEDPLACDIQGTRTFAMLQQQDWRSARRDGDCGSVKLSSGHLQLIEMEYLDTPIGEEHNKRFVGGVELNAARRPVNYHVVDIGAIGLDPKWYASLPRHLPDRKVISAENFLFTAHRSSYSQVRGMSGFVRSAPFFEQLNSYIEASIMAARMAAVFGLVIKRGLASSLTSSSKVKGGDGADYSSWSLEPGMIKVLDATDEFGQITPEQPGFQVEPLVRVLVRMVGLEWGMPLEIAWLDFSQTNYSSARASLLQAYLAWARAGSLHQSMFCRPVWAWKIDEFIRQGKLRFRADRYNHEWLGVGRGWIDPTKEVNADLIAVDAGFQSIQGVLKKRGMRIDHVIQQRKAEIEDFEAAGIPLMHSKGTRDDAELLAELAPDPAPSTPPGASPGEDESPDEAPDEKQPSDEDTPDEDS